MQTFIDRNGKPHAIQLTMARAMAIDAYVKANPECPQFSLIPQSEKLFEGLSFDPRVALTIAWMSSESRDLPIDQFAELLDGKSLEAMKLAVNEELADFFPLMRITIQTLTKRYSAVAGKIDQRTTSMMEKTMSDEMIDQALDKIENEVQKNLEGVLLPA